MQNNLRIVSAAALTEDGLIVPGVRHFSPDMRAVLKRIYGEGYHRKVVQQGFIDTHGNFLNRKDAWKRAATLGQVLHLVGGQTYREPDCGEELFSENLY